MKKEYIVPKIEVITFDDGDILTNSLIAHPDGSSSSGNELLFGWGDKAASKFDSTDVKNILD